MIPSSNGHSLVLTMKTDDDPKPDDDLQKIIRPKGAPYTLVPAARRDFGMFARDALSIGSGDLIIPTMVGTELGHTR